MVYNEWMKAVDIEVQRITGGISVHDLADFLSRDLYDSGASPYEGAMAALEGDDLAAMFMDELGW